MESSAINRMVLLLVKIPNAVYLALSIGWVLIAFDQSLLTQGLVALGAVATAVASLLKLLRERAREKRLRRVEQENENLRYENYQFQQEREDFRAEIRRQVEAMRIDLRSESRALREHVNEADKS